MKLHEAQLSAILPSLLQRVEFIPKFYSNQCYHKLIIIGCFVKLKISDFQTRFHDEYALLTPARHAVKVENRSRLTFL